MFELGQVEPRGSTVKGPSHKKAQMRARAELLELLEHLEHSAAASFR